MNLDQRRAGTRRSVGAALVAVALASCQWNPIIIDEPMPEFTDPGEPTAELALGTPLKDALDCPTGGRCQDRFRLEVSEPGRLVLRVDPTDEGEDLEVRVVLEGPIGVLDQKTGDDEGLEIAVPVRPGPHYVLIQALGGRFQYEVVARLEPGGGGGEVAGPQPAMPTEPLLTPKRPTRQPPRLGTGSNYDPTQIQAFPEWRYYAFADPPQERLQSGEKVSNPMAETEVLRATRYVLADRGYFQSDDPEEVQFLVSAHVGSRTTTLYVVQGINRMEEYDQWFQQWGVLGGTITPHTFTDGTVVIDFIDPGTGKLVWHGWTTIGLAPDVDLRDQLRVAVEDILQKFPPR